MKSGLRFLSCHIYWGHKKVELDIRKKIIYLKNMSWWDWALMRLLREFDMSLVLWGCTGQVTESHLRKPKREMPVRQPTLPPRVRSVSSHLSFFFFLFSFFKKYKFIYFNRRLITLQSQAYSAKWSSQDFLPPIRIRENLWISLSLCKGWGELETLLRFFFCLDAPCFDSYPWRLPGRWN